MNKLHAQRSCLDHLSRMQAHIHEHLADALGLNNSREVAPTELLTEIYMPLEG